MAEYEGELSLKVDTSEIGTNDKFKLSEEELGKVAGGLPPAVIASAVVAGANMPITYHVDGQGPTGAIDDRAAMVAEFGLDNAEPAFQTNVSDHRA